MITLAWNPTDSKRKTMPSSCFLIPSQRKYPWKVYRNGKWVPSATQLKAAISCANSTGNKAISAKAQRLLHKYFGRGKEKSSR